MGRAARLKKLRRELEKTTDPEIKLQAKTIHKKMGDSGQTITRRIIRHDPDRSRRGLYQKIKKQGDWDD